MATYHTAHAAVDLDASIGQVYEFFSHFTDFPKFIDFVEAITYHDRLRSHWVADIVGEQGWIALGQHWIIDQEIAWCAADDAQKQGKITFTALNPQQTRVTVTISYRAVSNEDAGELLGAGKYVEHALQYDLKQFAVLVNQSPARLIDPASPLALLQGDILLHDPESGGQ